PRRERRRRRDRRGGRWSATAGRRVHRAAAAVGRFGQGGFVVEVGVGGHVFPGLVGAGIGFQPPFVVEAVGVLGVEVQEGHDVGVVLDQRGVHGGDPLGLVTGVFSCTPVSPTIIGLLWGRAQL